MLFPDKCHWWFFLILDPHYVNEFPDVRALNEIDFVDTRSIVLEIMPKFYDYTVSAELAENPYTSPRAVTTTNRSLYFIEETLGHTITASRGGINFLRDSINSELKVFCNAAATIEAIKMKMCSPGTKRSSFNSQCCPLLPPYFFQYLLPKLKMRVTSTLQG